MAYLQIRLFGSVVLKRDDELLEPFPTKESEQLFAFLLLNRGQLFSRDTLIRKLYTDEPESAARKRLRTAIWRIRSVIEPDGDRRDTYMSNVDRRVGFHTNCNYWLDVQEFESNLDAVLQRPANELNDEQVRQLKRAVDLYRGDLLEGFYEDWCLWYQERLKLLLLTAIERLMNVSAVHADWPSAILHGHQLLRQDVLREHIHRDLMRFYYMLGDRPAALRQYEICAKLLRAELDIEPMRATTCLRNQICSEENDRSAARVRLFASRSDNVQSSDNQPLAIDDLHRAVTSLNEARDYLEQGIRKSAALRPDLLS